MKRIYMDHSATTAVRAEVLAAMLPYFCEEYGNASSVHSFGQRAGKALEDARATVAACIGASPEEIIFTSGGTESNNLAIKGILRAAGRKGRHVITSAVEHPAVLNVCEELKDDGIDVTVLPVDKDARVSVEALEAAFRPDTALVSIMAANNEVGTIEPLAELAHAAAEARVPFHTDAVQAAGKIPMRVDDLGVDLMSFSAHKFYGPKGVGALYIRRRTRIKGVQAGGHHERGLRAGTENVAGIVGMARALELACAEMDVQGPRLRALRDKLQVGLLASVSDSKLNGHLTERLPHLLNIAFSNAEGEAVLFALDALGVAISTGSACSSGTLEPSHVLTAMGISPEIAHGSLRISLGRDNTEADVDFVLAELPKIIERFRQMSPM